ncbi:MAG: porin, partial [Myxococcota bacterium]
LDAPIVNWPTIERTDQFARQLGFYAKGNIFGLDYRVAVVRPFTTTVPPLTPGGPANYNNFQNTWAYSGYFQYMFWDIEPNTLPYTVGTWIGTKRVLNVGAGYHIHPDGVAYITDDGELETKPLIATGVDMFADVPLSKRPNGGAITGYGVYYYYDFGPNNVRNIGIMNPGDPGSGTSFNGPGNAYPVIGTSHTFYGQLGWLLPWKINQVRFQPYLVSQMSKFQALEDPMFQFGVGGNVFIHGHNAKVTLEYRNRPIFDAETLRVDSRKGNSFVLQFHLFI